MRKNSSETAYVGCQEAATAQKSQGKWLERPKITGNNRLTPLRRRKNSGKLRNKPLGTVTLNIG